MSRRRADIFVVGRQGRRDKTRIRRLRSVSGGQLFHKPFNQFGQHLRVLNGGIVLAQCQQRSITYMIDRDGFSVFQPRVQFLKSAPKSPPGHIIPSGSVFVGTHRGTVRGSAGIVWIRSSSRSSIAGIRFNQGLIKIGNATGSIPRGQSGVAGRRRTTQSIIIIYSNPRWFGRNLKTAITCLSGGGDPGFFGRGSRWNGKNGRVRRK